MSKLEQWFYDFGKELWAQVTTRAFALWEVAGLVLLTHKQLPWWVGLPLIFGWLLLRSLVR